jgi:hypothetical protein
MGHLGSTARGQTPLTLAATAGARASIRAAKQRIVRRPRRQARARSGATSARGSTANDQRWPSTPGRPRRLHSWNVRSRLTHTDWPR